MPTPFDDPLMQPPPVMGAPAFGAQPSMMPALTQPPMATPPFVGPQGPQMPTFNPRPMPNPGMAQGGGAPNFMKGMLPILAAVMAGGKDPRAIGEGLAAFQKGRSLKQAERENQQDRTMREERERAEFYGRMIQNAQQFDDPVAFEQWRHAIAPMAELYNIPLDSVVFNSDKADKKKQSAIVSALDKMEGKNPDLVQRDDFRIVTPEYPDGVPARMARGWRGEAVGASGPIKPPASGFKANTPAEMRVAAYAKAQGKRVEDLTVEELDQAKGEGGSEGASDFDRHLQRHYAAVVEQLGRPLTKAEKVSEELKARKSFNQVDDKPADPLLQEIRALTASNLRNAKLSPAQESAARALADDFTRDTKDYQVRLDSLLTMREVMTAPSAAGDIALVFAFMKLQDPNSAVRETEYANAQNAAGVPERIRNLYNKLKDGEFLSESQRKDFLGQSQNIFRAARSKYQITRSSYEKKAQMRGIDPQYVITDYDALLGAGDSPAGAKATVDPKAATSALSELERRRAARGGK